MLFVSNPRFRFDGQGTKAATQSCSLRRIRCCSSTPENKLGIHALVFTGDWGLENCTKACSGAAEAGFDILEIPLMGRSDTIDPQMTKAVLAEFGIEGVCSLGLTSSTDISSENPKIVARGEEALNAAVDTAAAIGAKYLGGVIYSELGRYLAPPTEKGVENAVGVLQRVCSRGQDQGLSMGLEPCNRYETNVLNTARQAMDFIDAVGATNLGVHLDTYHMNIEETSVRDAIRTCGDKLAYVHIGESHRGALGTGSVDFESVFRSLIEEDYQGTLTFESFSAKVVDPTLSTALAIWRETWEDSSLLASDANAFMKRGLRHAVD